MGHVEEHREAAKDLLEQAKKLDPTDLEADSSLKLIEQLRSGAIKKDSLRRALLQDQSMKQAVASPEPAPPKGPAAGSAACANPPRG